MTGLPHPPRVLALDPVSRGLGVVVFENPSLPIEWGVRELRRDKDARCLEIVGEHLARFQPDLVVVEDTDHPSCRRCPRIRSLIVDIRRLARSRNTPTVTVNRDQVQSALGVATKHEAATLIARNLPELAPFLPPFRKPWMNEDPRTAIFDAAAFALTFYQSLP